MNSLGKGIIEIVKTIASLPYRQEVAKLRDCSEEAFWEFQAERFISVYQDALAHVPYYASRRAAYPAKMEKHEHILDWLSRLPVLPKSEVKNRTPDFWRRPARLLTAEHTTGGTTGSPLRVRASLLERGYTEAILRDRYKHTVNNPAPRILRLSGFLDRSTGDSIFQRIPGTKYAYLSIYELSAGRANDIRQIMLEFAPEVLHGYASSLHQLSLLFKESPLQLDKKLAVVSTSETLFENHRTDIESYLNAQVYNEYGSQEGQHLVLECAHRSLHIHPHRGVVEILKFNEDRPAVAGELGRVVVTGLLNRSMPLIRYDIGDSAISTGYGTDCACGLKWPTIGTVFGRTEDLVRTRDGRKIGLLSHSTLKDWPGITESQIIQNDFDVFTYNVVPQDARVFDRVGLENHVRKQLKQRIGYEADVRFNYVREVQRTSAGKVQAVIVDPMLKRRLPD